jgi:exopolysaccharide biosynthesis polyprenyl glycosylphosphotransferase
MLRERANLITQAHKALDIGLTVGAFIAAYFIKRFVLPASIAGLLVTPNYYIVLLMIIIIWYLTFSSFRVYASYRERRFHEILWNMVKAVSTGMFILLVSMYVFKLQDVSRILLGVFFLLNIALLGASKGIVCRVLTHYRKRGFNFRNVVIIGSRERARDVIDVIGFQLGAGFRVLGCLETDPARIGDSVKNGIKVIETVDHLGKILKEHVVDELIFAMPLKEIESADQYITLAGEMGVSVRIIPDWQIHYRMYQPGVTAITFEDFLGIPSMALNTTPPAQAALLLKGVFDLFVSGIALILLLPLFLTIACAIKIFSPGPVFFKQERCCLNGRRFMVYKFRTMVLDAERRFEEVKGLNEADGPIFKIKKDPRIIPWLGTFLRKTSLDELPQLINVFKGEMSLVGPRPPIPAEIKEYDTWQRRRLSMKPGMTCIWQCASNRNELGFKEWMKMDLSYIDNWSLWLDFKLLFQTVKVVVRGGGR